MTIHYKLPHRWIAYDATAIVNELTGAKAAVLALTQIPYQRAWAEALQEMELKREVAGTSKIEGAEFTEKELDAALSDSADSEDMTRSQKQARAAINTYRWIERLPKDRRIDEALIRDIHRRIVTGCDDDHCEPGAFRGGDQNVIFGRPRHRGVNGGTECAKAIGRLLTALNQEFQNHDQLIQAFAVHYHLGAMHPFQDGNGRTARALEALMLQRAHLKDTLFIAMSNYYYDEKNAYLACLSKVREGDYDLTPFLKFALKGLELQCKRLLREVSEHLQKSLFRDVMGQMYGRLRSTKKRALAARQCDILNILLERSGAIDHLALFDRLHVQYSKLTQPYRAYIRDLNGLLRLGAAIARKEDAKIMVAIRLAWATEITETEFYREVNSLPTARTRLVISQ